MFDNHAAAAAHVMASFKAFVAGLELKFTRKISAARPIEHRALEKVNGLLYYYDVDQLANGRVEAQPTRDVVVSIETVDFFFRLKTLGGTEEIELIIQPIPGVLVPAGYFPAGSSGVANATIEQELVNGRKVITSVVDGETIRHVFVGDWGGYIPEEFLEPQFDQHQSAAYRSYMARYAEGFAKRFGRSPHSAQA